MMLLRQLCDAYLADIRGTHRPSTLYNHTCFCHKVVRHFGNVPLATLTPDLLRAWKGELLTRYRPSTVHRYLTILQALLRFAVTCEWLPCDPLAQIRKPSPRRGLVRFLAPEECARLLQVCRQSRNPMLYPVVMLALSTGGRKDEVRCLRWAHVDLDAEVARFVQTKTGEARSVPLLGEALAILREMAHYRRDDVPWVFPNWGGTGPIALTSAWETARAQARLQDVRFHDLRHTFASYLAMSNASLREIAWALGHKSTALVAMYAHLTESHTRGVVDRMLQKYFEPPQAGR